MPFESRLSPVDVQPQMILSLKIHQFQALCPSAGCIVKDYGNLTFEDIPDDEPVGRVKMPRVVGCANELLAGAVHKVKSDGNTCVMLGGDHRLHLSCSK